MATILQRRIDTRIPQRDGRIRTTVTFTIDGRNDDIVIGPTLLEAGADVDQYATDLEGILDHRLKEDEWNEAVQEAIIHGLNPLRAERTYIFNTKLEIALRLKDRTDARVLEIEANLSPWQLLRNRVNTFLGTI